MKCIQMGTCIEEECVNSPVVLSATFAVCCRGKGDYFRLGHGTDVHVRKPQVVEGLRGKKIVHVAVGALHCLAVTDTGQVCCVSPSFPPCRTEETAYEGKYNSTGAD